MVLLGWREVLEGNPGDFLFTGQRCRLRLVLAQRKADKTQYDSRKKDNSDQTILAFLQNRTFHDSKYIPLPAPNLYEYGHAFCASCFACF